MVNILSNKRKIYKLIVYDKNMVELDLLDKKILFELDLNSRQSNQEIAKKIRSSKEVIGYRIKKLEENKVIFKYLTILDPAKLGCSLHKVMFKLENIDLEKKKEIVEYLKNHSYSLWTVECDGPFDIGFMVFARNPPELDKVITEVSNKLSKYIHERIISTTISGEYLSRKYLIKNIEKENKVKYGNKIEKIKLDDLDLEILKALSDNAKIQYTEIAKNLTIKIDAVRERVKKLEKSGIIKGYSILLNNSNINQLHCKILIYLRDFSEEKFKTLKEFCRQQNNITYIIKSLGVWDMEIDLEVESSEKYREIMLLVMKNFPEAIKKYEVLQIYQLHQYRYLPDKKVLINDY